MTFLWNPWLLGLRVTQKYSGSFWYLGCEHHVLYIHPSLFSLFPCSRRMSPNEGNSGDEISWWWRYYPCKRTSLHMCKVGDKISRVNIFNKYFSDGGLTWVENIVLTLAMVSWHWYCSWLILFHRFVQYSSWSSWSTVCHEHWIIVCQAWLHSLHVHWRPLLWREVNIIFCKHKYTKQQKGLREDDHSRGF